MSLGPTKVVRVATELLAQFGEWSEPVQVRVVSESDGELQMEFRVVETRAAVEQRHSSDIRLRGES